MKVLLIEDSETCSECLLGIYNKRWFCLGTGKDIDIISKSRYEKPSWCPLRPLPKKKTEEEEMAKDPFNEDLFYDEYIWGWNACLDAITGETE